MTLFKGQILIFDQIKQFLHDFPQKLRYGWLSWAKSRLINMNIGCPPKNIFFLFSGSYVLSNY